MQLRRDRWDRGDNTWATRRTQRRDHHGPQRVIKVAPPVAIKVALHMSVRPSDRDRTIRRPIDRNSMAMVLTGRLPAQMGQLRDEGLVRPR